MKTKRGFTLIEIIVAVMIIAILATLVIVNISRAQAKSRDAKRVSDLKSFQSSILIYKSVNNIYPSTVDAGFANYVSDCNTQSYNYKDAYNILMNPSITPPTDFNNFVKEYLNGVWPKDPRDTVSNPDHYCFIYKSNGADYAFMLHKDIGVQDVDWIGQLELIDPARDNGGTDNSPTCKVENTTDNSKIRSWKVNSPGGRCW